MSDKEFENEDFVEETEEINFTESEQKDSDDIDRNDMQDYSDESNEDEYEKIWKIPVFRRNRNAWPHLVLPGFRCLVQYALGKRQRAVLSGRAGFGGRGAEHFGGKPGNG